MELHVENMTCGGCARSVGAAVRSVDPAAKVDADPRTGAVAIETTGERSAIETALAAAGFPVRS